MKLVRSSLLPALVGALAAALVIVLVGVGDGDKTTTVVEQAPLTRDAAASGRGSALTAREIYKRDAPGVVNVRAQVVQRIQSPFDPFPQEQRGESTGSGFVVDKDGYILTNAHVIQGASRVTVQFEDKKTADGKVVGKDTSTDLALLKVDPDGLKLKPLKLGNSRNVQVGDPTIAIGNPFGLDRTLTTGVVSALQRRIEAPNGFGIDDVIQTDAAINPGNSGGPLIDAAGRVIGVNSQIATGGQGNGNVGIGFAVPVNTARSVIPQLKKSGRVERAFLGIEGVTIDGSLARLNLAADSGVLVQRVTPGSPAARAGVRGGEAQTNLNGTGISLGGDVIQAIDGKSVKSMEDVVSTVSRHKPGDTVTVDIRREGQRKQLRIKLATRPNTTLNQ
jgi:S1-C subfamily serine protease